VDDGLSKRLDKGRAQRIKQLGNSIVPPIAKIIAERIKHHETNNLL
jgi:site-specific DNA-cytosine methylase